MKPDEAAAWLEAFESGKLNVPRDVHDAEAWDREFRVSGEPADPPVRTARLVFTTG